MVRACRFLDIFLPQATFRSNLLSESSRHLKSAPTDDDSLSLTEIKKVEPDSAEKKALAEWESALVKMGKKAEKVDLKSNVNSSSDVESSEGAMDDLKKEVQGGRHRPHPHHHRRHSHSKKSPGQVHAHKAKDQTSKPNEKSPRAIEPSKDSQGNENAEKSNLQRRNTPSKVILDQRLNELMVKLNELNTKEQSLKLKGSNASESSSNAKKGDTAASSEGL
jgi:hypothetical protein